MTKNHPATDEHCPLDWLHQLQMQNVYTVPRQAKIRYEILEEIALSQC